MILWKAPILPKDPLKQTGTKPFSIIIPARNEEKNLPILLDSLKMQTIQPLEILVIDDHSEDLTAAVAAQYGAQVIQFRADETGWVGKSAACWHGAQAAAGEWLLFLDADIFLPEKNSLAKIVNEFHEAGAEGILSIQPYHVVQSFYENLSAIFNIMVLAGMNPFSILGDRLQPAGAFGPSLLSNRDAYFQLGGHKRARDSIMENVDLGKYFLENDLPLSLFAGKGALHFRMYPEGLSALSQGWSKSFASASVSTHPFILFGTSFWIAGAFLTFLYLIIALFQGAFPEITIALAGYLLYFLQFSRMARMAGNFQWLALFFYPVLFFYFVFLFAWSSVKTFVFRSVSWKGRKIKL